ncbi:MAG: phosphonate metabolism transcriptional regulator PhnF [Rhodospirillales bacterium]|nr:phosphonate metabolism transcriptional regulator PhnF [Rhodospirillales bacterium]
MTLERGSGIALWRQIHQALRAEIIGGRLQAGGPIPTEQRLAERFGVNRHTVRRATAALEEEGLIRVEQGRGMFVAEHVIDYRVGKRTRFTENLSRQSRSPGGRVLATAKLEADATISDALYIPKGTSVGMIRRLGEADDRPVSLSEHFFNLERFPDILDRVVAVRSISRALEDLGIPDYLRKITKVTTRMPDRAEAELLQLSRHRPLLISESVNIDPDGIPLELGVTRFAGDRVQLIFVP